jgi:hypothetical protein
MPNIDIATSSIGTTGEDPQQPMITNPSQNRERTPVKSEASDRLAVNLSCCIEFHLLFLNEGKHEFSDHPSWMAREGVG